MYIYIHLRVYDMSLSITILSPGSQRLLVWYTNPSASTVDDPLLLLTASFPQLRDP